MAYNPSTNIVVSGKTFMDVPAVQFKTPDGATVNFAHVGGQIRFSPTLEEQTEDVANYQDVIINPITSTLLNQLDSDFVAENIKKDVDLFGLLGTLEAGGGIELNGYQVSEGSFTISSDTSTFENYSTSSAQWPLVTGTNLTGKNFAFLLFIDPISVILTSTVRVSLLFASASSIDGITAGVVEGFDSRTGLLSGLISKHGRKGVLLGDKETGTLKIYFGRSAPLKVGTTFHWFLFVEGAA